MELGKRMSKQFPVVSVHVRIVDLQGPGGARANTHTS